MISHPSDAQPPSSAERSRYLWTTWAPIVLLLALLLWTGLRGVDFGHHWDEDEAQVNPVRWSLEEQTLLPNYYIYPSVNYGLNLAGLLPFLARSLLMGVRGEELMVDLVTAPNSPPFLIVLRSIRVALVSLAPLWIYLSVLVWRRSRLEALLTACILGLSWEIAYHARWVAPDAVVMQFGALTLLFAILVVSRPQQARWRWLAAIAAALATGTKYTAGLLILPVLISSVYVRSSERTAKAAVRVIAEELLVFAGAFLVTTPGAVLQPWAFLRALTVESTWYSHGHWGYTIDVGLPHLARMLEYVGLVLASPYAPIAAAFSLAAFAGVFWIWRESKRMAALLVLFPVAYLGYFATQRVMIVRNLLALAPFLALLAGRGIVEAIGLIRWRQGRWIASGLVAFGLVLNAGWLVYTSQTIRTRLIDRPATDLAVYLQTHLDESILLSSRVADDLAGAGEAIPANASASDPRPDLVAVYAYEAMPNLEWPANIRNLTVRTFGPLEVNFDYYPTWEGNDRIVVMTFARACGAGVDFVEPICP
jgi:hypothetical protein